MYKFKAFKNAKKKMKQLQSKSHKLETEFDNDTEYSVKLEGTQKTVRMLGRDLKRMMQPQPQQPLHLRHSTSGRR